MFLAASVVPVYFVWLTPELFNFSLALYAMFLWSYKEVRAAHRRAFGWVPARQRIRLPAAALIGVADVLEADRTRS